MRRRSRRRCWRPSAWASRGAPEIPVKVVPLGARFKVGPFDIELVSVAHSIPESNALIIRTPHGNVLHTGDWKIDPTPVLGAPTDEAKLRALGDEGCLALIGDSTNAVREGRSPSEADVAKTLAELIANAPGTGRRHHLRLQRRPPPRRRRRGTRRGPRGRGGRPRHGARRRRSRARPAISTACRTSAARTCTAICRRDKVVALCTGSQGEPRAALARIAADEHPEVALSTRRPRDLFLAPHPRQREGDRPRHQRPDRSGHRGHHRPHASGARLRPSAPRRARRDDRLGEAADRSSRSTARPCICPSMPSWRARSASRSCTVPQRRSGAARARRSRHHRRSAGRAGSTRTAAAGRRRIRAPSPTASG